MSPMLPRALGKWVDPAKRTLADPMIFVTGPRQVGKTAWARSWTDAYFNWDTPQVKRAFLGDPYFFRADEPRLVVLDEVHKRRDWKALLKGYFDSPDRLVREDVRDFSAVQRLDQLELLARLLPSRVSSPLSLLSLANAVEANPVGVKGWLRPFETLFFGFRLPPFHRQIARAVKREAKWYFYQWTFVEDPGARFENYLAVQLAAALRSWSEQGFGRWELFYLRDQDRREVDFLVTRDLKPQALIEAKSSPQPWPKGLRHYVEKLSVPGFLVYPEGPVRRQGQQGYSVPAGKFLRGLQLTSTAAD